MAPGGDSTTGTAHYSSTRVLYVSGRAILVLSTAVGTAAIEVLPANQTDRYGYSHGYIPTPYFEVEKEQDYYPRNWRWFHLHAPRRYERLPEPLATPTGRFYRHLRGFPTAQRRHRNRKRYIQRLRAV